MFFHGMIAHLFLALKSFIWKYRSLLIHSPTEEYFGCNQELLKLPLGVKIFFFIFIICFRGHNKTIPWIIFVLNLISNFVFEFL